MNSCVVALVADASATIATMRATTVCEGSRVTVARKAPEPLSVPANTSSSTLFTAGRDSPVTDDWSTSDDPAMTTASAEIRSPGRMEMWSPIRSALAVTVRSVPYVVDDHRPFGCEVQQAWHGVLGPPGRDVLEGAGRRKDDDQEGAIKDLADGVRRADCGDDHQQVDIESLGPQRLQARQGRRPAAGEMAQPGCHPHHTASGASGNLQERIQARKSGKAVTAHGADAQAPDQTQWRRERGATRRAEGEAVR